jgi:hypothetical protein
MDYKPKALEFLKNVLGEEGFEELHKVEIFKRKSNVTLDPEEIRTALQIVPRTVLSFLQKELTPMKDGEGKKIKIPVEQDAYLQITKLENDVYSGEIQESGKVISNFKYRSLPGVGLVIMSALELYDVNNLDYMGKINFDVDFQRIQNLIDERLKLKSLASNIIAKQMPVGKAVEEMIKTRLTQILSEGKKKNELDKSEQKDVESTLMKSEKKPLKLKEFLNKKEKKKTSSPFYEIKIEKNENVTCPDCGKKIFGDSGFSGCICFGPDRNKKIHIRKNEDGVALSFSKTWDKENIEMLLEVLRERENRSKE